MSTSSHLLLLLALLSACNFPRPANIGDDAGPGPPNPSSDGGATADAASADGAPVDAALVDAAPVDAALIDVAPVDAAPVDAPPVDAPDPPRTVIHVSPSGDDANDGITKPVKTLKHAIGLAAANQEIRSIALENGRYSAATGETFPYTVPPNVTVVGPAGGGATLAGTRAEPGMSVNSSGLQDVDLADFTTAITATG